MQTISTKEFSYQSEFSEDDFEGLSDEEIIDFMRDWFYENYEDPAERTPYESAEGGYIYIWGGPYYAEEELGVFYEFVDDKLIATLVKELNDECLEWTGKDSPDDYEESYFDFIVHGNEFHESFHKNINRIKQIAEINVEEDVKNHLLGMLYANVITAIETYLSDAFISEVLTNDDALIRFVETNPEFAEKTFKLSEIFKAHSKIKDDVKNYLIGLMWHNFKKIKPMFKSALNVDFSKDMSPLFKAALKRHDVVHRGGKNKDGEIVLVSYDELSKLIDDSVAFIDSIDQQIVSVEEVEF